MDLCPGCKKPYTVPGYLKKTEDGCTPELILMEQQSQAYCVNLRKYV